jgi:general stress protein YciG
MTTQGNSDRPKSNRGFASMDRGKQKEIASKGGKAAHAQGRAHEFTPDEARTAGRKGGEVVSRDRAHMAAIGRAGGQARGRNRALQAARDAQSTAAASRIDSSPNQSAQVSHSSATPAE